MVDPNIPQDPFEPALPRVSQEAIDQVSQEWRKNPSYLRETVSRLMSEQFDLTGSVAIQAQTGRDVQETMHALDTAALMYLLLEAQQKTEGQH